MIFNMLRHPFSNILSGLFQAFQLQKNDLGLFFSFRVQDAVPYLGISYIKVAKIKIRNYAFIFIAKRRNN